MNGDAAILIAAGVIAISYASIDILDASRTVVGSIICGNNAVDSSVGHSTVRSNSSTVCCVSSLYDQGRCMMRLHVFLAQVRRPVAAAVSACTVAQASAITRHGAIRIVCTVATQGDHAQWRWWGRLGRVGWFLSSVAWGRASVESVVVYIADW